MGLFLSAAASWTFLFFKSISLLATKLLQHKFLFHGTHSKYRSISFKWNVNTGIAKWFCDFVLFSCAPYNTRVSFSFLQLTFFLLSEVLNQCELSKYSVWSFYLMMIEYVSSQIEKKITLKHFNSDLFKWRWNKIEQQL